MDLRRLLLLRVYPHCQQAPPRQGDGAPAGPHRTPRPGRGGNYRLYSIHLLPQCSGRMSGSRVKPPASSPVPFRRRVSAASLLLALVLSPVFLSPLAPLVASSAVGKCEPKCCGMANGSCCRRHGGHRHSAASHSTGGPAWQNASSCSPRCGQPFGPTPVFSLRISSEFGCGSSATRYVAAAFSEPAASGAPLNSSLHQRPPPIA